METGSVITSLTPGDSVSWEAEFIGGLKLALRLTIVDGLIASESLVKVN